MSLDVRHLAEQALEEVGAVFAALTPEAPETLVAEVAAATRIALYGVGREGLMVKAFAMRLFHLGCDTHVVGDMTTPPLGPGDLLVVSAGPGAFSTVLALMAVAKEAGARTLVVTAQPDGEAAGCADVAVHLPAQTMADDLSRKASVLPMGSLYETALLLFFELVVVSLRDRLGLTPEAMHARHTNLE
jgi:6-phospho-3-hexuloisomerase